VVAGADAADAYVARLRREHPEILLLPPYGLHEVASLLEMADVVVVPQRLTPQTEHQQPSKLLDAMALAKPVVATDVADIGAILSGGRGVVVPPADVGALAAALDAVLAEPARAAAMGARAREWVVAHGSYQAMRAVLRGVIEQAMRR
jgi:glycosyltransferase involved in cell wall biosynthesis